MFKRFKERRAYKKVSKLAVTVSDKELDSYNDAGSISAEMALALIHGDKKAIKRYEMLSKDGVKHIT